MTTYSIQAPDGKTYQIDGPAGASQEQVQAEVMRQNPHLSAVPQATDASPRWDVLGDIGRSASGAFNALKQDSSTAMSAPTSGDYGPMASVRRMGAAAKVPLDALGIAASPIIGAIHGVGGSALSYLMPKLPHDIDTSKGPLGFGPTLYADPKRAADDVLDQALPLAMPTDPAAIAATAPARAANNAQRADAFLRNKAIAKVNERAAQDNLVPSDIASKQQQAVANGDSLTLMDLGGKNMKGLAGAVYRAPGQAGTDIENFLTSRNDSASTALATEIQGKVAKGSTYNVVQDLLNSRSTASRPAYDAAEQIGPIHSDRLQQFLDTPEVQSGLRRGLKLEKLNSISEGRPFKDSDYAVVGYKDGNFDQPIFDKVPTMKSMIVANEGLGAQIADMINPVTGRPTKDGLALKKFRDAFQGELDKLSGGKYAAARNTWSGPAQSMEAVQDGRMHFTRTESNDQLRAEFNNLSPADKDFYRLGAAEAKVDAVERAPDSSDKSKRVINSERDRKRFNMLFDSPEQAQQFIDNVARKRAMFDTKNAITGNSATAQRFIEDSDNGNADMLFNGVRGIGHAAGGNILGAIKAAYDTKRALGLRNNPALNNEITRLLLDPNLRVSNGPGDLIPPIPVPSKQYAVSPGAAGLLGLTLPQIGAKK